MSHRTKVILDTDPGIDDSIALCMLLQAHKKNAIEIVAITTVTGNSSLENVIINTYRNLEVMNLTEIPVYPGASRGLVNAYEFEEVPFHGHDGMGDVIQDSPPASISKLRKERAAVALSRLVEENKGEIVVIAIGPLTNLALAMNLSPEWSSNLKDLYIMGGSLYGKGNTSVTGEFNFFCDPEAAKVVFERTTIPIKLNTLEACKEALHIYYEERIELGATNSPVAEMLNQIESPILAFREYKTWITYDQLSVAWFLDDYAKESIVMSRGQKEDERLITKKETVHAFIETSGAHTRGLMIVDWKNMKERTKNITYIKEVNKELYMKYLKLAFL